MAYAKNNGNGANRISEWKLKELMCDIGRRIWLKGFCAGNEGNHSYRLSEDRILCTPTGISKGQLKPDDLCVVDMEGKQVSGKRGRTSEILLHLAIYKNRARCSSGDSQPSAACDGFRDCRAGTAQLHSPRGGGVSGPGADGQVCHARRHPARRDRLRRSSRMPTPCCSAITARSPSARIWRMRTTSWRSSMPIRESCCWPSSSDMSKRFRTMR